jgi:ATP-dependent DNA helicase PIF1
VLYHIQKPDGAGWTDVSTAETLPEAREEALKKAGHRALSAAERRADMLLEVLRDIVSSTASMDREAFRAHIDIAKLCLAEISRPPVRFEAEGLTPSQYSCLVDIMEKRNVLITGPAGTGKSFLLKFLRDKLGPRLRVVATTGVAAVNVGGSTLHSWAGIGLGEGTAEELAAMILESPKATARVRKTTMLAVDEVSMLDADLFCRLDEAFRIVRKKQVPFGGIQMVLFGDFLQLPPVAGQKSDARFAFQSPSWKASEIAVHQLTTVVRQSDSIFVETLSRVRMGIVDSFVRQVLSGRIGAEDPNPKIEPVVLECRNVDVDAFNRARLDALPGVDIVIPALDSGESRFSSALDKSCLAPADLRLKAGAQVMLLKNLDVEGGLVNGSVGIVQSIGESSVRVDFGTAGTCEVQRARWSFFDGDGNVLATREQMPLRLAYAITIHKSQGCTLTKAKVNLRSAFAYGQAYVALSRVRDLSGLYIEDIRWESIMASPEALAFYRDAAHPTPPLL